MNKLPWAQVGRWLGFAITAFAIGLVVWSIYTSDLIASDEWNDADVLIGLIVSTVIYTPSLFLVAAAWYLLTTSVSKTRIFWWDGFYIYATSAIYRYIPSNVIHYIGRHALLRQRGVEHAAAAWGSLAETALLLLASTFVALVLGTPLLVEQLVRVAHDNWLLLVLLALFAIFLVGIAARFVRRRYNIRDVLEPFWRAKVLHAATVAFALYVAARTISGMSLYYLSIAILDASQLSMADMIAVGAAAWTLGYVAPGASAGIGVREAVMIAALVALDVSFSDATLLAIVFRLTTTFADLLFTALGWALRYTMGPPPASGSKPAGGDAISV